MNDRDNLQFLVGSTDSGKTRLYNEMLLITPYFTYWFIIRVEQRHQGRVNPEYDSFS